MSTFTAEPGTKVGGRYRLEDRVAAAAGWAAWKAIDETLARAVTVVTFAAGFPRVREVLTAARAASRLTDARLAQVFDVEDDWDNAYIVMEWAAGPTLDDLIADGPVDPVAGARIIAEASAALSVAHAAGLAHLCLTPDSLCWTPGGGVKVTGIGINAALSGTSAEDPELADTHGLGRLLYAALTGLWPGPDYPALPPAPYADGHPRRPRQIRAGVPPALDEVTCQAMQMPGRDGSALTTPGQLAGALAAELPPEEVPPADPAGPEMSRQRSGDYWADEQGGQGGTTQDWRGPRRREGGSKVRTVAIGALLLVVVLGIVAATSPFWHKHSTAQQGGTSQPQQSASAQTAVLTPVSAHGFDALNLADSGDENNNQAANAIDGNPAGWSSQFYRSANLGGLKVGTGLILDMGKTVRLTSVTVKFGADPGADVQLKLGDSDTRSAANLASMTTVASADNVGGSYTFNVNSTATGQYVVIWFTKMPKAGPGEFTGQVFAVSIKGTAAPS
ncbi:MAG TPA: protein kinase family protein [Streptosporangiaceae bacterium]|jgi:hypothetical protein